MKNPGELADYILTMPGVKERGVTKKDLLFKAREMRSLLLPTVVEMGHMSVGRWQDILDIYKSLNLMANDQKIDGFIYNQQKATEENLLERALIIFGIVVIILAILFAYSISLKRAVKKLL